MRSKIIRFAIAMASAALGPLILAVGPAMASGPIYISSVTDQDSWSGYSSQPAKGYVWDSSGNWVVPKVTCPLSLNEKPMAAAWVGMWGSNPSMAKGSGWLPQIGTASECAGPGIGFYRLVWQMYSQVNGGGNGPQTGLDCPGDSTYFLCGNITNISPGDKINAAVAFLGPYTSKKAVRTFEIRLTDLTTGQYAQGDIKTNKAVLIQDIARQGGVIVENKPPCQLKDFLTCVLPAHNGLADFRPAIPIWNVATLVQGSSTLEYHEWVMKLHNGHQLASNESLSVGRQGMSYKVRWRRRN
jgi:hypothetical protein